MKILLVKHGHDMDDVEDRFGGWSDVSLSDQGRTEALNKIPLIKSFEIKFEAIVTSPFKRTLETAEIINKEFNLPIKTIPYLKEINSKGIFSGLKESEVEKEYPEEFKLMKGPDPIEALKHTPGAENHDDFEKRIEKAFQLISNYSYQNLIMVVHGGTMGYIRRLLNKTWKQPFDFNNGYIFIEIEDNTISVISSNLFD